MNVLIDIGHPSHVHYFKNIIKYLQLNHYNVIILATDKDVTYKLLNRYGFSYYSFDLSLNISISFPFIKNLIKTNLNLWRILRISHPDIFLTLGSTRSIQVATLLKKPSILVIDSEHTKLFKNIHKIVSYAILSSNTFNGNYGKKHIKYKSYDELTYLHPKYFKPDKNVLKKYNLVDKKYIILRFVSWKASHDRGQKGFDFKTKKEINDFLNFFIVRNIVPIILSENPLINVSNDKYLKIDPVDIHDLLFYSLGYIGEGATLAAEAALLGVPSIYVSTISLGYLNSLKNEYNLINTCVGYKQSLNIFSNILNNDIYSLSLKDNLSKLIYNIDDINLLISHYIEKITNSSRKHNKF